jgi:hypothetical protein
LSDEATKLNIEMGLAKMGGFGQRHFFSPIDLRPGFASMSKQIHGRHPHIFIMLEQNHHPSGGPKRCSPGPEHRLGCADLP